MSASGQRIKGFATRFGKVALRRRCFRCQDCGRSVYPLDRALGLSGVACTPGAMSLIADTIGKLSVEESARMLKNLAGLQIPESTLHRWSVEIGQWVQGFEHSEVVEGAPASRRVYVSCDGTGIPMRKPETEGVRGKQEDGSSRTRESRLLTIHTADKRDKRTGDPVKDPGSEVVSCQIDSADSRGGTRATPYGQRSDREFVRNGVREAGEVIAISDGAAWIRNHVDMLLSGCNVIHVLDAFHAKEYLSNALKALWPDAEAFRQQYAQLKEKLLSGKVAEIIAEFRPHCENHKAVARCVIYYTNNRDRMHYDVYRRRGIQIGSGVVEGACSHVVVQRMKRSGCHWSTKGANAILAIRCCTLNGRWADFLDWQARQAAAA